MRATKSFLVPGDDLEVLCSNPNGNVGTFRWNKLKGNSPGSEKNQFVMVDPVVGPKLRLNNLQISDRGVYRCTLTTRLESIFADFVVDFEG